MSDLQNNNLFMVGRLATLGKVGIGTVRYYQKLGLLPKPLKPKNGGHRTYSKIHLDILSVIRNSQALGFSLKAIGEILHHREVNDCLSISALFKGRQNALRNTIRENESSLKSLQMLVESCDGKCDVKGCQLFEQLDCLNLNLVV